MSESDWVQRFLPATCADLSEKVKRVVHGMRLFALSATDERSPCTERPVEEAIAELQKKWSCGALLGLQVWLADAMQRALPEDCCLLLLGPVPIHGALIDSELLNGEPLNDEPPQKGLELQAARSRVSARLASSPREREGLHACQSGDRDSQVPFLLLCARRWGMQPHALQLWEIRWRWIQSGFAEVRSRLEEYCSSGDVPPGARTEALLDLASGHLQGGRADLVLAILSRVPRTQSDSQLRWLHLHGLIGGLFGESAKWRELAPGGVPKESNPGWYSAGAWPNSGGSQAPWRCLPLVRAVGIRKESRALADRPVWDGTLGTLAVAWRALLPCAFSEGGTALAWNWIKAPAAGQATVGVPQQDSSCSANLLGGTELGSVGGLSISYAPDLDSVIDLAWYSEARAVATWTWRNQEGRALAQVRWEWSHWYLPARQQVEAAGHRMIQAYFGQRTIPSRSKDRLSAGQWHAWVQALLEDVGSGDVASWKLWGWDTRLGPSSEALAWQCPGKGKTKDGNSRDLWHAGQTGLLQSRMEGSEGCTFAPIRIGQQVLAVLELHATPLGWPQLPKEQARLAMGFCFARFQMARPGLNQASGVVHPSAKGCRAFRLPQGDSFLGFFLELWNCLEAGLSVVLVGGPGSGANTLLEWVRCLAQGFRGRPCRVYGLPDGPRALKKRKVFFRKQDLSGHPLRAFLVPRLGQRREEIPALAMQHWAESRADCLRRVAGEGRPHGKGAEIPDWLVADLWRQDWAQGIPQLLGIVSSIAVQVVPPDPAGLRSLFAGRALEFVERIPSQPACPEIVACALHVTRTASGRLNKTRAASYLGWDRDTLNARMREFMWAEGPAQNTSQDSARSVPVPDPWNPGRQS